MTGNSAPVRLRMIEAMTRRAQAHEGEARRIMDARLATLKAAHEQAVEATRAAQAGATTVASATTRTDGPLAQLARYIAQNTAAAAAPWMPPASRKRCAICATPGPGSVPTSA